MQIPPYIYQNVTFIYSIEDIMIKKVIGFFSLKRVNCLVYIVSVSIVFFAVYQALRVHSFYNLFNPPFRGEKAEDASISNIISGNVGTSLIIIGAILSFIAFWVQFYANRIQRTDITRERFENKYFELLHIYREIVSDIHIETVGKGKQVFHFMFYDLKALLRLMSKEKIFNHSSILRKDKLDIGFDLFLDGVSKTAVGKEKIIEEHLLIQNGIIPKNDFNDFFAKLVNIQTQSIDKTINVEYLMDYKENGLGFFGGHRLRLIPYFKHIHTLLNYINSQPDQIVPKQHKIDYVLMLFNLMSEHEIAILKAYVSYGKCHSGLINPKLEYLRSALFENLDRRMDWEHPNFFPSLRICENCNQEIYPF